MIVIILHNFFFILCIINYGSIIDLWGLNFDWGGGRMFNFRWVEIHRVTICIGLQWTVLFLSTLSCSGVAWNLKGGAFWIFCWKNFWWGEKNCIFFYKNPRKLKKFCTELGCKYTLPGYANAVLYTFFSSSCIFSQKFPLIFNWFFVLMEKILPFSNKIRWLS
jgi:hypothetical protein